MPISDVVFLEGNDPEEVVNSEDPYSYGKWFNAKNIDTIPLSLLGEFLGVSSYKELMKGFQPVHPPEGEAFVLSFPKALQDRIRSLNDDEISEVINPWSRIEEFHDAPEESLRQYLAGLRDFLNENSGYANLFLSI
ncbi:hypothetical protein [Marinobacter sp. CA1]|uniref:hypothetical protein n=1 Tax=Marinobacter sp. CA1 TaxID=2817656 RepID=UPI001D073EF1|nr:hypothetical protein [Marinobacter sp. CA1]UDL06997.1 hypothetical protein J2887_09735 [Marinobacter sp. CA1]